ncbi:conjugal transfer protein [Bacillus safensis]|uniref:conjugal transfer protein n=1 Tax=Bacillus safensis TaxID=561879 RepID=UPI00227E3445|nr:conjugal transfer protein [Bacillus safensis]MCY7479584.1 conjugal transfer protein [Bacillus safensis]MCY7513905.1 conjugal transfer protein [Bacillus safensis]MED0719343.1 conjugal transfer protein [Bacillus safensis]MED4746622.1 conjugal transfer protein [Bacillus safensis]
MSRFVFNYRKAMREPKKIQRITENYSLPFSIELIPMINYFIFVAISFGFFIGVRKIFPHAFENTFVIVIFGIPLGLTILITKIKPEGKNIYLYFWGLLKYLIMIKLPKKRYCNDKVMDFSNDQEIKFKSLVKVVRKNGESENINEEHIKQYDLDKNG